MDFLRRSWGVTRGAIGTLLRAAFCGAIFWAFIVGSYAAPINAQTALALAIMLSLLLTHELAIRDVPPEWVLRASFGPFLIVAAGYMTWLSLQPPPPTGPLLPAGEKSPPLRCAEKPGPNDFLMTFGTDAVIGKGPGPFTPIFVADCPLLSLVRQGNRLMVESFGYDGDGDVAFRVKDNVVEPFDTAPLRVFRPDASTFVLLNGHDEEVIYVRYLNPHAVRIRGHFRCGEAPQALIQDNRILVGGFMLRGGLFRARVIGGHVCATIDAQQPDGITLKSR